MELFENISTNFDLKKISKKINYLVCDEENAEIIILLENPINKTYKEEIVKKLKNIVYQEINKKVNLKILYVLPFKLEEKDIRQKPVNYFYDNKVNLKKHIKPNSKIICVGKSIYSITHSDDLISFSFYDIIFNKSYFYSPEYRSYFYPVDSLEKWLHLDSFENFFARIQIKKCYNFKIPRKIKQEIVIKEVLDFDKFIEDNSQQEKIAIDTETTSLDFIDASIICVTISFDGITGYYIDWKNVDVEKFGNFIKNKYQILANSKFDFKMFLKHGVKRDCLHCDSDVINLAHLLNEMSSSSLKTSAWLYSNYGGYEIELDKYKEKNKITNYADIPKDILLPYATKDAIITYQVEEKMLNLLKDIDNKFPLKNSSWSLLKYYKDVVIPSQDVFLDIEYSGIFINKQRLDRVSKVIEHKQNKLKKKILKEFNIDISKQEFLFEECINLDEDLNIASTKQLGELFESLGWENLGRAKNGIYLTGEKNLAKWAKLGHKEAQLLLDYRELSTLMKTFVGKEKDKTGLYKFLKKDKYGRYKIHSKYAVMLANSHRSRSYEINSQNIPNHGKYAKLIRSLFTVPSLDYIIGEADAKGLQLRICGILAQDKELYNAFTKYHGDLHSVSAQAILKKDVSLKEFMARKGEKKFKNIRIKAKAINFSLVFNTAAFSFAKQSLENDWSLDECKNYVHENNLWETFNWLKKMNKKNGDYVKKENSNFYYYWTVAIDIKKKFFEKYPDVKNWIEDSTSFAKENGYIRSNFAAIRRLPQLLYRGKNDYQKSVKKLENISVNSPVQTYESVLMMLNSIKMQKYIKKHNLKSRIMGCIHDSFVFYIHRSELEEVAEMIRYYFERDLEENKSMPMQIDLQISDYSKREYWGYGKTYHFNTVRNYEHKFKEI